jgi:hypothetical protein
MARKKEPDKLAQDAAAALAAGMSYGKWKAMQEPVKIEKKAEEIPEGWLICKQCGKPFKPKTYRKQKYCEMSCQQAAQKERDRGKYNGYYREYQARKRAELKGA